MSAVVVAPAVVPAVIGLVQVDPPEDDHMQVKTGHPLKSTMPVRPQVMVFMDLINSIYFLLLFRLPVAAARTLGSCMFRKAPSSMS